MSKKSEEARKTELENEIEFEKGWHKIGDIETDCKINLKDSEKIEIGSTLSEALHSIGELEQKKSDYDKSIKGQIAAHSDEAHQKAKLLKDGFRTERLRLPCFIDVKNQERVYIDLGTGEEMNREQMHPEDRQLML